MGTPEQDFEKLSAVSFEEMVRQEIETQIDNENNSARFKWLLKKGISWNGCYGKDWKPGEWLYGDEILPGSIKKIDDAMNADGRLSFEDAWDEANGDPADSEKAGADLA